MKKKRKIQRSIVTSVEAIYRRGMELYLQKEDVAAGLECLLRAGRAGYKKAYGEIGIILYRERNETEKAEEWFKKAEKTDSLSPVSAHEYGMLYYLEKGEWDQSLKYLRKAARDGYELAFGQLGSVLYLEKGAIDEAEECFKKAEKAVSLLAPYAYDYGMLLIEERGDAERGNFYLDKAAQDGYPPESE